MKEPTIPNIYTEIDSILKKVGISGDVVFAVDLHIDYRQRKYEEKEKPEGGWEVLSAPLGCLTVRTYQKENGKFKLTPDCQDVLTTSTKIAVNSCPED